MTEDISADPSNHLDDDALNRHSAVEKSDDSPGIRPNAAQGNGASEDTDAAGHAVAAPAPSGSSRPSTRRHLMVLGVLLLAFVAGVTLVVTGRSTPKAAPPATSAPSPPLTWLGSFPSSEAATHALGTLDPITLGPHAPSVAPGTSTTDTTKPGTESASGPRPTRAEAKRCAISVQMQSADRNLGDLHASIGLAVGRTMLLAQSFALPASGKDTGGTRVMVSDARSCKVQFAFDVPPAP